MGKNLKKKYDVTAEERAGLLEAFIDGEDSLKNVRVEVVSGLIWKFAKREGATILFRGIRSWKKDGRDELLLKVLNTWGPVILGPLIWPIPTVYVEGKPAYHEISSTMIRSLSSSAVRGGEKQLSDLVPPKIASLVAEVYGKKKS